MGKYFGKEMLDYRAAAAAWPLLDAVLPLSTSTLAMAKLYKDCSTPPSGKQFLFTVSTSVLP